MTELETARDRILDSLVPLPVESVALASALGRFAAEPHAARTVLPGFDNSSVDGFAVRDAEVASASPDHPVRLAVAQVVAAGDAALASTPKGACHRIFTGAPLPPDCNAIVMQEDTRPAAGGDGGIEILSPVTPWENVRFAGEDIRLGSILLRPGDGLGPAQLALLAAGGWAEATVHRRPRVALFSTGNELRPPGSALAPGQIHDSNRVLLSALATAAGAEVVSSAWIPDTHADSVAAFQAATTPLPGQPACDVIITTGGVSVGDADHLKPAWLAAGGSLEVWRIAMKPGKPFAWGRLGQATWFGLPGNPVSAFVTWMQLVRPALRRFAGAAETGLPKRRGILQEEMANRGDRRHFVRIQRDSDGAIRSAGTQASHILSSLALANGLLDLPPRTTWNVGREVVVECWE